MTTRRNFVSGVVAALMVAVVKPAKAVTWNRSHVVSDKFMEDVDALVKSVEKRMERYIDVAGVRRINRNMPFSPTSIRLITTTSGRVRIGYVWCWRDETGQDKGFSLDFLVLSDYFTALFAVRFLCHKHASFGIKYEFPLPDGSMTSRDEWTLTYRKRDRPITL